MKIVPFLLALYVVCLVVYPCGDTMTCAGEPSTQAVVTSGHLDTGADEDICSPFCICTCCASQVRPAPMQEIATKYIPYFTTVSTPYLVRPTADDRQSIFQPPRA